MQSPERSEPHPHASPQTTSSESTGTRRDFVPRLVAALRLEPGVYREVEHDPEALAQAAGVVGLAALAGAVGSLGAFGPAALLGSVIAAFTSWLVWTALVWLVGVKIFEHTSDFEELLRVLGFVAAPQLLYALAVVPFAPWQALVGLAVLAMTAIAFVRATREALDVETGRALVVAGLGILAYLVLGAFFGTLARIA